MKLNDIIAVLNPATSDSPAVAAEGNFNISGTAVGDGDVTLTIDADEYTITPTAGDGKDIVAGALADEINAGLTHDAVDLGGGSLELTDRDKGAAGNDIVFGSGVTDTGVTVDEVQPSGGLDEVVESEASLVVTVGGKDYSFLQQTMINNPSLVRRVLAKGGSSHDLATEKTSQMLAHAIVVRIMEQL